MAIRRLGAVGLAVLVWGLIPQAQAQLEGPTVVYDRPSMTSASTLLGGRTTRAREVLRSSRASVNLFGGNQFSFSRTMEGDVATLEAVQLGLYSPLSPPGGPSLSYSPGFERRENRTVMAGLYNAMSLDMPLPGYRGGLPRVTTEEYTPRPNQTRFERLMGLRPTQTRVSVSRPATNDIAAVVAAATDREIHRRVADALVAFRRGTVEMRDANGRYPNCRDCDDQLAAASQNLRSLQALEDEAFLPAVMLFHAALLQNRPSVATRHLMDALHRRSDLLTAETTVVLMKPDAPANQLDEVAAHVAGLEVEHYVLPRRSLEIGVTGPFDPALQAQLRGMPGVMDLRGFGLADLGPVVILESDLLPDERNAVRAAIAAAGWTSEPIRQTDSRLRITRGDESSRTELMLLERLRKAVGRLPGVKKLAAEDSIGRQPVVIMRRGATQAQVEAVRAGLTRGGWSSFELPRSVDAVGIARGLTEEEQAALRGLPGTDKIVGFAGFFGDVNPENGQSRTLRRQMQQYARVGETNPRSVEAQVLEAYCAWQLGERTRARQAADRATALALADPERYGAALDFVDAIMAAQE